MRQLVLLLIKLTVIGNLQVWLGYCIDLAEGAIPVEKIVDLKELLARAEKEKYLTAREIAGIVGKIISMFLGLGAVARLRTRSLYRLLDCRSSWYTLLPLTKDAKEELQFWYHNIDAFNGQNIWRSPSAVRVVYSDASDLGYGGYVVQFYGY